MHFIKYTPGPWMAWDTGNGISICPAECANALIPNLSAFHNEIVRLKFPKSSDEDQLSYPGGEAEEWELRKTNAQLIAAAPDLLEALIRIAEQSQTQDSKSLGVIAQLAIEKLRVKP